MPAGISTGSARVRPEERTEERSRNGAYPRIPAAMGTEDRRSRGEAVSSADRAAKLFAVRLWKEELGGGSEYRGSVRDVATDAYRGFRDWSDLVAFMVASIEGRPRAEEVRDVSR